MNSNTFTCQCESPAMSAVTSEVGRFVFPVVMALGLGGCGQGLIGEKTLAADVQAAPQDCPDPGPGALLFWMEPESLMPGTNWPVIPYLSAMPGIMDPLPSACLTGLEVVPSEAAEISVNAHGEYEIEVTDAVPIGTEVDVRGQYKGRTVRSRFTVFRRDEAPLTGYWRQNDEGCDSRSVIQELVFNADGSFSVTWEPFEVYKDYWGKFTYNDETGQLDLDVETGNFIAQGISSGTIRLEGDRLTLGTASFGQRFKDAPECRAPFN